MTTQKIDWLVRAIHRPKTRVACRWRSYQTGLFRERWLVSLLWNDWPSKRSEVGSLLPQRTHASTMMIHAKRSAHPWKVARISSGTVRSSLQSEQQDTVCTNCPNRSTLGIRRRCRIQDSGLTGHGRHWTIDSQHRSRSMPNAYAQTSISFNAILPTSLSKIPSA